MLLDCAGRVLDLSVPRVMGILNVTPDSFADGGDFLSFPAALVRAERLVRDGADIIDVGGESTRPGAAAVSVDEELRRVIPVIEAITRRFPVVVSVDTSKATVMRAAAEAGAGMINDVFALRRDGAMSAAVATGLPVCLMHMQGVPGTMQSSPRYDDVLSDVRRFLLERVRACQQSGIPREKLLVDPGFGFGKTLEHNLALLSGLDRLAALGVPLLVGFSRKSMLGAVTGRPVDERMSASVSAALLAVQRGAAVVRVHDVSATVDALKVLRAVSEVDVRAAAADSYGGCSEESGD
jgi:dihydropteroate synthase